ncbi:MAG TPA: sigma-54 dependent transcriptional regulator [Nitrospirota bacterium]|nr:sigma-54 dependent transcriptional regulator [Nitrospirota bacterium]
MQLSSRKTLLIIDDEKVFCNTVRDYLENERLEVLAAHTGAEGLAVCSSRKVDVVLLDQKLPDGEGHALAPAILEKNDQTKIIFITAYPSFENAVTAVRLGAHDYLSKPFDIEELRLTIENTLRTLDLERVEQIQNYARDKEREASVIVGNNGAFGEVVRLVDMAAAMDGPVLITGETGTGKNLVAKTIHYKSAFARSAFISINCAALPDNLIEAELFGYEKGAFTGATGTKKGLFEIADGGTVFLDEIGDMPLHLQTKLLSVLEDKMVRRIGSTAVTPVSVRIIAATNAELESVLGKTFRKDLYFRLSVVRIHVPPLREHREDIPALCSYLLAQIAGGRAVELPEAEIDKLKEYDWPGNVRELRNILERALFLQKNSALTPSQLIQRTSAGSQSMAQNQPSSREIKKLAQAEQELIHNALILLNGNLTQSAKALGISLSTLKRKIKEYSLK